ncbi:restriction endonuclease subunit S [Myxococcota bacterium]|nr:restriction endonuclease subunit S [Myxococcota bacterium]MBU1379451.1 restriction endonuclease subunit S [Myxococcota bacterium]MBU1496154.1 restriction endonuclease subunit S [Myxococcota bacterium]
MTLLKEVADIQMGYSFRSRLEPTSGGNLIIIQMKDLGDEIVDFSEVIRISFNDINEKHFVKTGDLVFRTRGNTSDSAIISTDPGNAVIAAPLLRIRIKNTELILPEFLNWYMSQKQAQAFLESRANFTVQKMISKETLENLEVPLLPIQIQTRLIDIAALARRENEIIKAIAEKKYQLITNQLCKIIKKGY